MKLTAAKFALFVFVLLALGMFVAAVPQGPVDDATGDTGTTSPVGGGTNDPPATPGTGKTGGGTTTGGGKTGTDTGNTDDGSTTKTPGKSTDEPSDPPPRTGGGSKTTPDEPANGDDTSTGGNDATPKTSQGSGNAKNNNNNNNNDDNSDRNNDNNGNNGKNRNANDNNRNRNGDNNNNADSNDNAKGAKNAETPDNNSPDEPAPDSTDSSSPVPQETGSSNTSDSADGERKLALNATCTSNDVCDSGLCQDGKCAEKEDDDKIGKTLGMALGVVVAAACIVMVLTTGVRMMLKRRRSDYYSKRISELAPPSRATTPSFYHDSTSLVLEKQARNGNYAFNSPDAAVSSDSVRPPAQGYYGAADGYDMEQSYTRTGMPNYANDQHMYAPNAPANDWSVTPTYGAFPTTAAPDPSPIPVPQPTMLPVPAMSSIPPRNVQPAADPRSNGSNALGDLLTHDFSGGAGERDSELIMYGGAASQNLTRESMYDASDDQENDGGRYKMNSIYSAYGRDSLYADTKDAPSVPDVPDLPSQYQK